MNMLRVRGVTRKFGALVALNGVDLDVKAGEFHGLIGPNGSGKSTLLKCLAGALTPDSGTISLLGRDITSNTPFERSRAGLSIKFQITSILPKLSVYDNMLLAFQADDGIVAQMLSRSRRHLRDRIMSMLQRYRLASREKDLAGDLSHGQQQWLEIAMAVSRGPKVLLLDEPTAGMSPQERRATGELLLEAKDECPLVIVEHDLDFIRDICESLTVLDQGRVVASGPLAEVQANQNVREAYLKNA
jgi:branched-chain amino acid transport system ATP-binding protein